MAANVSDEAGGSGPRPSPQASPGLSPRVEAVGAFVVVTVLVSLLYRLRGVGFVERNLAVIAAVLFLYLPALLLWRRGRDLEQYGLRLQPLGRGLAFYGLAVAVVLPLFALGYWLYVRRLCPWLVHLPLLHGKQALLRCPPLVTPALRPPPDLLMSVLSQILVVALPEEFFFRGFILGRLGETMSPLRALLLSALLFALGHYFVTFDPGALAVFFPALLFGLLRLGTGSVLAGTLFHATCNLLIDTLHRSLG